jgi:hypothetical protein
MLIDEMVNAKTERINLKNSKFLKNLGSHFSMGLHNPPDGITNPKCKLLCFLTAKICCCK